MSDTGRLQINLTARENNRPITDAVVTISDPDNAGKMLEEVTTNRSGQTPAVELTTPPLEYSMQPEAQQPYGAYDVLVTAAGYETVSISGAQIFAGQKCYQDIKLERSMQSTDYQVYAMEPHTLYGDYPPKIPEEEIKEVNDSGEIVLSRVVIPEYIVVHDGSPLDKSLKNYEVLYKDYIKNVAACEIYATWPEAALRANIMAIMSFTLNRVYTEWYRGKAYNFTISSSTAYDQKWMRNKTTYDSINKIVDEMFNQYIKRPGVRQPLLSQYCDGRSVSCPGQMTQWGSKALADEGRSWKEILKYYYGQNLDFATAERIAGVPSSYPGSVLRIGSSGAKVRQMQEQLNKIAQDYPSIPKLTVDGIFGSKTEEAVKRFQQIFGLSVDGKVGFATWYKISQIYVGVSKIAELR